MFENLASFGLWLMGVLVAAAIIHYAFVRLYPYLAMRVVFKRGAKQLGINEIAHRDKPTARFRAVVRPSPDLIYSGCVFDLSEGPLQIRALLPDTYMSVSMYANNTDNFFSINDQEAKGERLNLVLLGPTEAHAADFYARSLQVANPIVICAPSSKGIMLLRYFYGNEAEAEQVEMIRRKTTVMPLRLHAEGQPSAKTLSGKNSEL